MIKVKVRIDYKSNGRPFAMGVVVSTGNESMSDKRAMLMAKEHYDENVQVRYKGNILRIKDARVKAQVDGVVLVTPKILGIAVISRKAGKVFTRTTLTV